MTRGFTRLAQLAVALLVVSSLIACGLYSRKRYRLRGVVQEIRSTGEYVVAHEDIKGFMPAMTMPFHVRDAAGNVRPGDRIEADLVVTDAQSWLEGVRVIASGLPTAKAPDLPPAGAAPGEMVRDFRLVNQSGKLIRLADYRGRTLALTFIYTRCALPEYCPLMMRNFKKLDERIAEDPTLLARTHLLSISFDTTFDTPEVLSNFGKAFVRDRGAGPFDHWELASGSEQQIGDIAGFFGLAFWREEGQITHSLCTAIIRPDGRLAKVYRDNLWTVDEALGEMRRAAS